MARSFNDFVLGIILAWAWNKSKSLFKGSSFKKGINFGLAIWIIATIPGMLVSYSCFVLSGLTIISWVVDGLVNSVVAGLLLARMNR